MELKVKMKLNDKQEIETSFNGADLGDVILKASALLDFDGECGFCKKQDFQLRTRIAGENGEYKYTEFICRSCGAKRQMGKHKADNSFFLKQWEPKYEKPQASTGPAQKKEEMPEN